MVRGVKAMSFPQEGKTRLSGTMEQVLLQTANIQGAYYTSIKLGKCKILCNVESFDELNDHLVICFILGCFYIYIFR